MHNLPRMQFWPSANTVLLTETLRNWRAVFPLMGVCAFLAEAQKHQLGDLQAHCSQMGVPLIGPSGRHSRAWLPGTSANRVCHQYAGQLHFAN
jgi:hypothetical protein